MRTHPRKEKEVTEILLEMAESVQNNKELGLASVYFQRVEPNGFSLILQWNTVTIPQHGSDTAMLILGEIRSLGLFDHTLMLESGKSVNIDVNGTKVN